MAYLITAAVVGLALVNVQTGCVVWGETVARVAVTELPVSRDVAELLAVSQ